MTMPTDAAPFTRLDGGNDGGSEPKASLHNEKLQHVFFGNPDDAWYTRLLDAMTVANHFKISWSSLSTEETRERLYTEWGTIGIVGALMGAFSQTSAITPPDILDKHPTLKLAYGGCSGLGFVANVAAVILSVMFSVVANMFPNKHMKEFVVLFARFLYLPFMCIVLGVCCTGASMAITIQALYQPDIDTLGAASWTMIVVTACGLFTYMGLTFYMYCKAFNKLRAL